MKNFDKFAQALLDGKEIIVPLNMMRLKLENGTLCRVAEGEVAEPVTDNIATIAEQNWQVYEPWYTNIPREGVLCTVWDALESATQLALVMQYCPSDAEGLCFAIDSGEIFEHAIPLTNEEIKVLLN